MVVIAVKGSMVTAKNDAKIPTRNYADWKLLRNECRESVQCDDSDSEDAFKSDAVTVDRAGSEQSRTDSGENAVPTDRIREPQCRQEQSRAKMNVCRERNIPDQTAIVTVKKDRGP